MRNQNLTVKDYQYIRDQEKYWIGQFNRILRGESEIFKGKSREEVLFHLLTRADGFNESLQNRFKSSVH